VQSRTLLLAHFGKAFPVDALEEAWFRHFWAIAETHLALKPRAAELFRCAQSSRFYRVPSRHLHPVARHLGAHGLTERFDAIVGHGDNTAGKQGLCALIVNSLHDVRRLVLAASGIGRGRNG
jgi:hypothetical protein